MLSNLYALPSKKTAPPRAAKIERDALSLLCRDLGLSQVGRRLVLLDSRRLAMPASATPEGQLAMIAAVVLTPRDMTASIGGGRLSALVAGLIDMNPAESKLMTLMAGQASNDSDQSAGAFHTVLLEVIRSQRLHRLFDSADTGQYHRGITPGAYNERTGEIYAEEMAAWRAEFRAMAPEQQMLAATIIWLYQSGPDSTWLRRVPCTWSATEALHYMKDAGCLSQWLRLLAAYPGW